MKPTLKAPGTKRLKLKYDVPVSNFAFNFNLHRYISVYDSSSSSLNYYGRAVQVDPMKPTLKAPGSKRLKL